MLNVRSPVPFRRIRFLDKIRNECRDVVLTVFRH
jgi:hypothetical protein